jgi:fucose permease
VPPFFLACLAYVSVALPGSTLGLLWPSMRLSLDQPVGALGILLVFGVIASVISSAATGHILSRISVGWLLALGTMLVSLALGLEAAAPELWVVAIGAVLFSLGFGAIDSALNAYAAHRFGARQVNWMHASYGLGATIGPLVVTALLANGFSWRSTFAAFSIALAILALVFGLLRRRWGTSLDVGAPAPPHAPGPGDRRGRRRVRWPSALVLSALVFSAIETGVESGPGIWGFLFLTAGRGLSVSLAGVAVSFYWAMMFVGRAVFGPVAERVGASRVLSGGVAGVLSGAALMTVPGPAYVAVIGMMVIGLAAAPIFPLLTLTTAQRVGASDARATTTTASLQVAASAIGAAALPAVMGVVMGAVGADTLGPLLLVFSLALLATYALLSSLARTAQA